MRAALVLLLVLLAAPALAAESPPQVSPRGTASLISASDSVVPGRPLRLALRLHLAPGWHTYWRNPGDAGAAPSLDLTLPGGTAGPMQWPTPTLQREGPLVTYGYSGEVVFPVTVTGAVPGRITAEAQWLACRDICVPEEASFTLTLPAGDGAPSAQAGLFADAAIPHQAPGDAHIAPDGTLSLQAPGVSPEAVQTAHFFPIDEGRIRNDAPQRLSVGQGSLLLQLAWADGAPRTAPLSGELVLHGPDGQASNLILTAAPGPVRVEAASELAPAPVGVAAMLGLALLGGLILNLMPCVFPVLALKAIGLAQLSGAARGRVRAEALSYTAGVLVTFGMLGGVTLALRAAGDAAGWGFQFASPVFVAATGWVLFGVGLNLSGVFEVGGAYAGAGQSWAARHGHLGSFFTGLLSVVVATPCTAPFMGAALAAALSAPEAAALATFLALGVGLAAPTLLLAAAPGLARALPKPGPWMAVVRQALAFPMYGAAAWLVWVASEQAGSQGVMIMLAGALLVAFAGWMLGAGAHAAPRTRSTLRAASFAAALGAVALLPGLAGAPPAPSTLAEAQDGQPFTTARLASLRASGRPVFVNLTAAWCVTCMVNERVALRAPEVRRAFANDDVAYLVGDWTRQDPDLTRFLRARNRDGVPLYLFFPAGGRPAVELPQILTARTVLRALAAGS